VTTDIARASYEEILLALENGALDDLPSHVERQACLRRIARRLWPARFYEPNTYGTPEKADGLGHLLSLAAEFMADLRRRYGSVAAGVEAAAARHLPGSLRDAARSTDSPVTPGGSREKAR
jgi:hypothetical protein